MNIAKIGAVNSNLQVVNFKGTEEYENPVSRGTERNLAILASTAGSTVLGAIVFGIVSSVFSHKTAKEAGGFLKAYKLPLGLGLAAAAVSMLITLPAKLYNTKVNAFVKQKEMDVFSRDRELKSNLTEEVHNEVKDPEVSLDKKLDDNLKLQMANRGSAIGIANVTPQS